MKLSPRFPSEILGLGRDWLDVRLPLPFEDARRELQRALDRGGELIRPDTGEVFRPTLREWQPLGRLGYQRGVEVEGPPTSGTLRLMGDHPSARSWSMLSASQHCAEWAAEFARIVRPRDAATLPALQVNRVDVALDYRFPADRAGEMFEAVHDLCASAGIRHYREGTPGLGETVVLNWSKAPEYRASRNASLPIYAARCYQKGIEQGALIDRPGAPDVDWWRFELIVRPDKPIMKEQVFDRSFDELLAAPKWSRDFLGLIGYDPGARAARLAGGAIKVDLADEKARKAKAMRTLGHMADQYAKAAQELAELVGWERVEVMVLDALRTGKGEVGAQNQMLKPGDALRSEADQLWIDRFDARFTSQRTH